MSNTARATKYRASRQRWAFLIKKIYQADPLLCPKCGGLMKIIAFIEARQGEVIRNILQHCGLWQEPPARSPPTYSLPSQQADLEDGDTKHYEPDPDFLEYQYQRSQCQTPRQEHRRRRMDTPTARQLPLPLGEMMGETSLRYEPDGDFLDHQLRQ